MRNSFTLTLIFLAFHITGSHAQSVPVFVLKGFITNASTGEPVPYASICLADHGLGTMTNEKGYFLFKIPPDNGNDSVYISHIGYQPFAMRFNMNSLGLNDIKLQPAIDTLSEVVIKTINPNDLIKRAISSIPDNYPVSPYRLSGFYRLTGLKEKKIIDISEAVFEIYNENYKGEKSQFKLIKSRIDKDLTAFNGNDNVEIGLTPQELFGNDVVSDLKSSPMLSDDALKAHQFSYRGIINYNGETAYSIAFYEKDGIRKSLYEGKMIIGTRDLAFLEFNIHLSPKGLKYYSWGVLQKLMMSMTHITVNMLSDNLIITYRKYGGKYYLNHVNNYSRVYLSGGKNHFLLDPLVNKINYLITRIDTLNVLPFQKKEMLGTNSRIESQHFDTAAGFWENYNLILPDFNLDSAAKIIGADNATLNYKQTLKKELSRCPKNETVRIDSIISFYHQKNLFSGTALVQSGGKIVYEKGWGFADKEVEIPNSVETQFRIGSTSKQFTAMLIMQLVSENKLSVQDTVGKFLAGFRHGAITIQQLLTHQSGVPNYTDNEIYLAKILKKGYTPDELVYQFCSDSLVFDPGTAFQYSNSNYVILADVIEKITNKKYADDLSDKIFIPLGMKDSYFLIPRNSGHLAKGYMNEEPEKGYPVENVVGAGGITSTCLDLLIWAKALDSGKLISKPLTEELFKPRVEWKDWDAYYGYGWMIDRNLFQASKKHIVQYHPGTEFGFYDMFMLQPDKGIVLILMSNTGDFPRFDMSDLILDELN
jgi:CubicO group peptidase (beta-lactamase class C family)